VSLLVGQVSSVDSKLIPISLPHSVQLPENTNCGDSDCIDIQPDSAKATNGFLDQRGEAFLAVDTVTLPGVPSHDLEV
jgi:hypothetical protein